MQLYNDVSYKVSEIITRNYSTSFSRAVSLLDPERRQAIHSIYGFVRLADEIVDTFHDFDKPRLFREFEQDYYTALERGISMNPVLNSFQETVRKYRIGDDLVQAFLRSMKKDLVKNGLYEKTEFDEYVYGSAEVVGLMCLRIFAGNDDALFEELKLPARRLGAAFQKVNFLRDLGCDTVKLGRIYFPGMKTGMPDEELKQGIISDITDDFKAALPGIRRLPEEARLPVLVAYYYYLELLERIKKTPVSKLLSARIRVPDSRKLYLLISTWIKIKAGFLRMN